MLLAWLFTFPAAALVAAVMERLTRLPGGAVIVFVIAVLFSAGIFFVARAQATAPPSGGLPVTIPAAPVTSGRPR